jgi:8-oxo-dGTP pyrophosphatase MutT (NUDIX family)
MIEVVDADDNVLEVVDRVRVRAERLRHRTAFVVVRSSRGEILVHRRALTKPSAPGEWDLGFGGGVEVGESYEAAAARELAEEAGIDTPLRLLTDYSYDGPDSREIGRLYETVSDGPFVFPVDEVAETRFVDPAGLDHFVATHQVCHAAVEVMVAFLRPTPRSKGAEHRDPPTPARPSAD